MANWVACSFVGHAIQWVDPSCSVVFGRSGLGGDDKITRRKSPDKGWSKEEWQQRVKEPDEALEKTLRAAYAEITADEAPISVLARVDAIARPFAAPAAARAEPLRIDWRRLARDYERATALFSLQAEERELRAQLEDEDDLLLMLQ